MKTDFATGRKLDLDKSYKNLIKPVVEAKSLECIRADEIRHSGTIDVPMYEQLLTADVVIADLSTANPNALYELGIRHALRPHTTIVVSENKLPYPFDLNHVLISSYTHLGEDIGFDEVMRFREALGQTLDAVLKEPKIDSPIYTFLHGLNPPLRKNTKKVIQRATGVAAQASRIAAQAAGAAASAVKPTDPTLSTLIAKGEQAIKDSRFADAKSLFAAALQIGGGESRATGAALLHDPYLQQRLVLATYKAKQPDEAAALDEALRLLAPLQPGISNDPETVGLAGAIEKRLFDQGRGIEHLDRAIRYYGRGYYLRDDWYNGINLAYLLTLRADKAPDASDNERIADLVWANRIRREVLALATCDLDAIRERRKQSPPAAGSGASGLEQEFWCLATKAEAHFGLREIPQFEKLKADLKTMKPPGWMSDSFESQIGRLAELLGRRQHLIAG
ncbi:tetratricopeptide repeat-containing protein [Methylobacterium sp. EM32]|uniref:tetratricopeptide repeat-containing protein n=1 Tax=Methylobacterium sp. EM32 TaxID=3163481 RepID=UPI0033BE998F